MYTNTHNRTAKDILFVASSNIIAIFTSLLTGFVIPKILGVEDYGYYKTFFLYSGYTGLFHFGFCDGILLIFAGKRKDDLDENDFLSYTRFLIILESIISAIIISISLLFLDGNSKFIFSCVAIYLFLQNIMSYYQNILQCTQQFKEYAAKNVVNSILTASVVISMWAVYKWGDSSFVNFKIYVSCLLAIFFILALWFVVRFRKITFGKASPFSKTYPTILKCFKYGFPLLIANLCSGLILTFDSQFVNVYFTNEIFAKYAFAYSVLGMVTKLISAVTVVLYPMLKQTEPDRLKELFPKSVSLLLIVSSASLFLYFLLDPMVRWVLPQYVDSISIFRIILPGLLLSSIVSVIIQNYYKTFNKPGLFFLFSAITLAVSVSLNFVAYYLFKSTAAISWASVITLSFYYLLTLIPLIVKLRIKWVKNTLFLFSVLVVFYLCFMIDKLWVSFIVFFVSWAILLFSYYYTEIHYIFRKIIIRK